MRVQRIIPSYHAVQWKGKNLDKLKAEIDPDHNRLLIEVRLNDQALMITPVDFQSTIPGHEQKPLIVPLNGWLISHPEHRTPHPAHHRWMLHPTHDEYRFTVVSDEDFAHHYQEVIDG